MAFIKNIVQKKYLILALVFHLLAAWFSIGRYHADEQFQIIEFTGYKTGVNSAAEMPWEFHEKMRPAIQVFFAYTVIKVFSFISNPFTQVFLLRLFASLLGLLALYKLLAAFKYHFSERQYQVLCMLSCVYCFIPYFHARFSSENISSSLFILGFTSLLHSRNNKYLLAGLLFGLAYTVRMQSLFMIAGLGLWMLFINKNKFKDLFVLTTGFAMAVGIGLLCDRWFYGQWVNSTWNYVFQNIVLHKSAEYGTQPFWFYFERTLLDTIPPFSLIIIASFFILFIYKPKHILTWTFVPFLLVHLFTAHKELRFLFPFINFIPLVFVFALKEVQENKVLSSLKNSIIKYKGFYTRPLFIAVNSILLLYLCFKPADDYTPVLKFLYNNYGQYTTTMYYTSYNPYDNLAALNFYKSKNITPVKVEPALLDIQLQYKEKMLMVSENDSSVEVLIKKGYVLHCVYSSIPDFMYYFNFNGWIERSSPVKIYELQPLTRLCQQKNSPDYCFSKTTLRLASPPSRSFPTSLSISKNKHIKFIG